MQLVACRKVRKVPLPTVTQIIDQTPPIRKVGNLLLGRNPTVRFCGALICSFLAYNTVSYFLTKNYCSSFVLLSSKIVPPDQFFLVVRWYCFCGCWLVMFLYVKKALFVVYC